MCPAHALHVLLDSNLPTGGFVASSGLESYAKHGFLQPPPVGGRASASTSNGPYAPSRVGPVELARLPQVQNRTGAGPAAGTATGTNGSGRSPPMSNGGVSGEPAAPVRPVSAPPLGPSRAGPAVMHFSNAEMDNFEASTGPYLVDAWHTVRRMVVHSDGDERMGPNGAPVPTSTALQGMTNGETEPSVRADTAAIPPVKAPEPVATVESTVAALVALDEAHETTLLSHVARRASKAQGVALLTLFARGMGLPPGFEVEVKAEAGAEVASDRTQPEAQACATEVVGAYRRAIRLGAPGHMAVCFGVVTACLGLDLETARHLYLFTHARSILSAAVRLNVIGPYLSTQLLSHPVRTELAAVLPRVREHPQFAPVRGVPGKDTAVLNGGDSGDDAEDNADDWAWADAAERGPATTWPLGEILAARHDLQHSRIFNS